MKDKLHKKEDNPKYLIEISNHSYNQNSFPSLNNDLQNIVYKIKDTSINLFFNKNINKGYFLEHTVLLNNIFIIICGSSYRNEQKHEIIKLFEEGTLDSVIHALNNFSGTITGLIYNDKSKKIINFIDLAGVEQSFYRCEKSSFYSSSDPHLLNNYLRELKKDILPSNYGTLSKLHIGFTIPPYTLTRDVYCLTANQIFEFDFKKLYLKPKINNYIFPNSHTIEKNYHQELEYNFLKVMNSILSKDFNFSQSLSYGGDSRIILSSLLKLKKIDKIDLITLKVLERISEYYNVKNMTDGLSLNLHEASFSEDLNIKLLKETMKYSNYDSLNSLWSSIAYKAKEVGSNAIFNGLSGDVIAGTGWVEILGYFSKASIDRDLMIFNAYDYQKSINLNFNDAINLLGITGISQSDFYEKWYNSFNNYGKSKQNIAKSWLEQRMKNRNAKQVVRVAETQSMYAKTYYPFNDIDVFKTYLKIPYKDLVNFKAHISFNKSLSKKTDLYGRYKFSNWSHEMIIRQSKETVKNIKSLFDKKSIINEPFSYTSTSESLTDNFLQDLKEVDNYVSNNNIKTKRIIYSLRKSLKHLKII